MFGKKIGSLLLMSFLASFAGCKSSEDPLQGMPAFPYSVIEYFEATGSRVLFAPGIMLSGAVRGTAPVGNPEYVDDVEDRVRLVPCTTVKLRCLRTDIDVFAVPKGELVVGDTFVVHGVRLRIEKCLRNEGTTCESVLVLSACERFEVTHCSPVEGGREKSDRPGLLTYFIYDKNLGITSFGSSMEWPSDPLVLATMMRLSHGKGILYEPK